MEEMIFIYIILGIPAIFFILFIKNIERIIKSKKDKIPVKNSLIIKAIIFGVSFILIVIFYMVVRYSLTRAVANM